MANELKRVYHATTDTLEASGGSCSNNAIVQANDASYDLSGRGDYPHARLTFTPATWSNAPNDMGVVEIVCRSDDVDGTADTPDPTATYRPNVIGRFLVKNVTTSLTYECYCYDIPRKGTIWLYNDSGQTIASGWALKLNAFTFAPT